MSQLDDLGAKPTCRIIDDLSIRFVESERRDTDALLLSPAEACAFEPGYLGKDETLNEIANWDVYGITRRGLAASGYSPTDNFGWRLHHPSGADETPDTRHRIIQRAAGRRILLRAEHHRVELARRLEGLTQRRCRHEAVD
jgi:hypothetical protein